MKKLLILCAFLFSVTLALAQKNKPLTDTQALWQTYRIALEFNDMMVAKNMLFQIVAAEPANMAAYDSLAGIYFMMGAYPQALLAADKAVLTPRLNEIRAYCYRNLGEIKTALELFEELFAADGNPENGYQVASLQFSLKRMGECEATLDKILKHPESANQKVVITMDKGESQEVSYLAAAENLKGVMMNELGKTEIARGCFERALTAEPGFGLAKNNLESLGQPAGKE